MIEQFGVAIFGVTAVYLSQDHRSSRRKWACIFGLCSQPFWFYITWQAQQWGIFLLALIYTYSWGRGVYNNWLRPASPMLDTGTQAQAQMNTTKKTTDDNS